MTPDDVIIEVLVIFDHPIDYPNHFVIRPQFAHKDGSISFGNAVLAESLDAARSMIPADKVQLLRHPNDDPKIVETWL